MLRNLHSGLPLATLVLGAGIYACGSGTTPGASSPDPGGTSTSTTSSGGGSGSSSGGAGVHGDAGFPAGWLYTSGSKILVSDGSSGAPWIGRGVNVDDIFLCGYNNQLQTAGSDATLTTLLDNLVAEWKPTFLRLSLAMNSNLPVSWLANPTQYKTPMEGVVHAIGKHPGVYVLVTLRSDSSMIAHDPAESEASGLPSDAKSTPNATSFPRGTDPVYEALVDSFAHDPFVLFGVSNEPGGGTLSDAQIRPAMDHVVGVIRAEEDRLGVPHHIVSVQGKGWTSDVSAYAKQPLAHDNVVYEVHGYPPPASAYTFANIPVILGEYGTLGDSASFFADLEAKQIPSLAWDFEPFSPCTPDLLNVNYSATNLSTSSWGDTVKAYVLAHAK